MRKKMTAVVLGGMLSMMMLGQNSSGAVTTTTNNGITMQVGLMDAEPPLAPLRNSYNLNMMVWLDAPSHAYTPGYWRATPADVIPGQDMWRTWDVVYSSTTNFNLWNCVPSPTGQYSNELGTLLQAPLVISTTNNSIVFYPSNITYQWTSSDTYNAFNGVVGTLSILQGAGTTQSWSSTCVGVLITNGMTNLYTTGLMTNPVNMIYYSGVYAGFAVTNGSNVPGGSLFASNYASAYWPFSISATYKVSDNTGTTLCQATASLDSKFHWHVGNTTMNTTVVQVSPGNPVALSIETWDRMLYTINTFSNGFSPSAVSNEVYFATLGDGDMIMSTNTNQFFRAKSNSIYAPKPLGVVPRFVMTAPPVISYQ